MSELALGKRFVRVEDGQRGVVADVGGHRRITYYDRGTLVVPSKNQQWVPEEEARRPLRAEEKLEVALRADQALCAIERNEPDKFWERPLLSREPYDPGLVLAIVAYLSSRG